MILIDVHPATVQFPDGTVHDLARASVTHRRVRVWVAQGRESALVVDEPHDGVRMETQYPPVGQPVQILTAAGPVLVTRMRGCGCGSPLKGFRAPTDDDV